MFLCPRLPKRKTVLMALPPMNRGLHVTKFATSFFAGAVLAFGGYFALSFIPGEFYRVTDNATTTVTAIVADTLPPVTHIQTPEPLKAIYVTACVAGTPSWRTRLAELVKTTELNALIIDIKDYSGTVSFKSKSPLLKDHAGTGCRTNDMREFIETLHRDNIYVIGRITVFQDPYYTKLHPELAVKKLSDDTMWKDYKGLSFIDVGAKAFWEYIATLAKESYAIGFDELNFDYVRFPSDGNMKDIDYTWSRGKTKADALEEFFVYLHDELKVKNNIPISADLFGMTTTNTDDLNIGQVLERTLPYFDGVYPMVYPSHYPKGFNGWSNPNDHVYDVVHFSMSRAVERANRATTSPLKLRPWIQDFDYGGNYGATEVRAQIQATYDSGLTSWLIWDPGNKYTVEALLKE